MAYVNSAAASTSGSLSTACAKPPAQKSFLPLPGTLALVGLAGLALARRR